MLGIKPGAAWFRSKYGNHCAMLPPPPPTSDSSFKSCFCFSKAWSSIVYMLIPNVSEVERSLGEFADIMEADEVLLFERATFLVSLESLSPWKPLDTSL